MGPQHAGSEVVAHRKKSDAPVLNGWSGQVWDACIEVHRQLGPGLLESVYRRALAHELGLRGLHVRREVELPISYKSLSIESGLRLDLLVMESLVVEVKATERHHEVHSAQLLSYLKLGDFRLGILANFGMARMVDGLERIANGL